MRENWKALSEFASISFSSLAEIALPSVPTRNKIFTYLAALGPPEVFKPRRRQLGVAHRVLDVPVAEIGL